MILNFLLLCALVGSFIGILLGLFITPSRKILAVSIVLAASAGGLVGATLVSSEKAAPKPDISSKTTPDMASPCPEHSEEVVSPDEKTTLRMWLARHPEEEGG